MTFNLGEAIQKELEEALKQRGRAIVLIAGRSGVGKSTLINAVFQGNMAEAGQGKPVTPHAREITKEGIPLTIIDTRGLELDKFEETLNELEVQIARRSRDPDQNNHVHVAWMCISEDSRRVETGEAHVATMLAKHVPVLGVITKARSDQGFRQCVQELLPQARAVLRVRSLGETDDEGNVVNPKGLVELVDATMEVVPEGQRNAFAAAQKVSIELKKNQAHKIVAASAAAAFGVGASPIPFSDAVLLAPIQIAMLAGISLAFGLDVSRSFLNTLISGAALTVAGTAGGPALVGALLKFLPGGGTIVGGVISGAVAATITTAFGSVAALMVRNQAANPTADEISVAFISELSKKKT